MASGALCSSCLGRSVDGQVGGRPIVRREGGWRGRRRDGGGDGGVEGEMEGRRDGGEVTEPWEKMGLHRCVGVVRWRPHQVVWDTRDMWAQEVWLLGHY
jgi:hypothetical protein